MHLATTTFVQRQNCCWQPPNPNPTVNVTQISNLFDSNEVKPQQYASESKRRVNGSSFEPRKSVGSGSATGGTIIDQEVNHPQNGSLIQWDLS